MKTFLRVFLAVFFFSAAAARAAEPPVREIKITAAVSSSFKKNPEWEKEVKGRLEAVNDAFEKTYGVHFSILEFKPWEPQDEKHEMGLLIEELRAAFPIGPDQIVMGFHEMSQPFGAEALEDAEAVGSAQFFRGYLILRDPYHSALTPEQRGAVLEHEVAHLFGAVHVAGPTDIMNAALPARPSLVFDESNQDILKRTVLVDFQKGIDSLSPETLDGLINIYEHLIRANPLSDFYYELGNFYRKRGLEARAVSTWEEAVRRQYDNPLIHRELGFHYYQAGNYDLAIQELGAAVAHFVLPSQKKERAQTFNFLGVAYYEKGNREQAVFNWLKGLGADPDDPIMQGNLAVAYLEGGDLDRGIGELEKLLAKNPDDPTTLSNLGIAYLKKKDQAKAARYFQAALEKKGLSTAKDSERLMQEISESSIRTNLGAAYLELGDPEKALAELEQAKALDPKSHEVHRNLALVYVRLKQYEKVIAEAQEALRVKNDDANMYTVIAQSYAETGQKGRAVQMAREALRYTTDGRQKASLHKNVSLLLAQDKNYPEAISEMKEALNHNWNDGEAHMNLGFLYLETGHPEEARRSLENALRMDPKLDRAKKTLEALPKK